MTAETPTPKLGELTVAICDIDGHAPHAARVTVDYGLQVTSFCLPPEHAAFLGDALASDRLAAVTAERDALRERAEASEAAKRAARGELAALEDRLSRVIAAAVVAEQKRAEAADAKVAEARAGIGNFLAEYGASEIPMFKVAQDLANSLRKILGGDEEASR
jgi:hypothetical protein